MDLFRDLEKGKMELLENLDGIVVPGGFGSRGVEGMILTSKYCRENKIPYFGICLGMQVAIVDIARNLCHLEGAHSMEVDENTPHPVIEILPGQEDLEKIGGTLRLGNWICHLKEDTLAGKAYGKENTRERHRHRYEFNNDYKDVLGEAGLIFSGMNYEKDLVEIVELRDHPFFLGCQFHPEFKSRPNHIHPLFRAFIKASAEHHG